MENKYKVATLSPLHFIYTTLSGSVIRLHTLTYLQLRNTEQLFHKHGNSFQVEIVRQSLNTPNDLSLLTVKDITTLHSIVITKSVISNDDITEITTTLDVIDDEKYQTKEYMSCEACQLKGLDKVRNCPLLDKATYDKSIKFIIKNNYILKECPVYPLHYSQHVQDAFELKDMLMLNILPIEGGLMNQTPFVFIVSKLLRHSIEKRKTQLSSVF